MKEKILIVEDDLDTGQLIKTIFASQGMVATHAINGQEGSEADLRTSTGPIILDVMMPEMDGYELCSRVREFSDVPVLMLTAKTRCQDVQRGFAVGADEYIRKPFKIEELLVRADYLLKRHQNARTMNPSTNITEYSDGALKVNLELQQVFLNEKEVCLTSTEYKLLEFLVRHPNKTLSVRTLLTEVGETDTAMIKACYRSISTNSEKSLGLGKSYINISTPNGGRVTHSIPFPNLPIWISK